MQTKEKDVIQQLVQWCHSVTYMSDLKVVVFIRNQCWNQCLQESVFAGPHSTKKMFETPVNLPPKKKKCKKNKTSLMN